MGFFWQSCTTPLAAAPVASTFMLVNGLQVVVVPDRRVPVVTHMIWYKVGAADDPEGRSGLAHLLEHQVDRTDKTGKFSRIISRLGGRDNAVTEHDKTPYYQRVAKRHLRTVMELEADRMVNIRLIDGRSIDRTLSRPGGASQQGGEHTAELVE